MTSHNIFDNLFFGACQDCVFHQYSEHNRIFFSWLSLDSLQKKKKEGTEKLCQRTFFDDPVRLEKFEFTMMYAPSVINHCESSYQHLHWNICIVHSWSLMLSITVISSLLYLQYNYFYKADRDSSSMMREKAFFFLSPKLLVLYNPKTSCVSASTFHLHYSTCAHCDSKMEINCDCMPIFCNNFFPTSLKTLKNRFIVLCRWRQIKCFGVLSFYRGLQWSLYYSYKQQRDKKNLVEPLNITMKNWFLVSVWW